MLNKMSMLLAATAVVALSAGTASAQDRHDNMRGDTVAVDFNNVAFGYQDGYWDTGHQWHHWAHNDDARLYRNHSGSHFHNWAHTRDSNNGWEGH
ncbi:MAG TPA: hypothetical protein VIJ85_00055 [Rhizomicrobium sp.]